MRMHNRSMFRKYIRHVDIGENAVNEVWHGDTMLYPDNETIVRELRLSVPDEGTEDWAYWVHAIRGVTSSHELYSTAAQVKLVVGAESWWCGDNRPTNTYRCGITEEGVLTFNTDEGPPAADVEAGAILTLEVSIPAKTDMSHYTDAGNNWSDKSWGNPWLPGTILRMGWYKSQKKNSAGVDYVLRSMPSKQVRIRGRGQKNGHKREWCGYGGWGNGDATNWACRVCDWWNGQSSGGTVIEGDTYLYAEFNRFKGAGHLTARVVYPAFKRTFSLKVKSVIVQGME